MKAQAAHRTRASLPPAVAPKPTGKNVRGTIRDKSPPHQRPGRVDPASPPRPAGGAGRGGGVDPSRRFGAARSDSHRDREWEPEPQRAGSFPPLPRPPPPPNRPRYVPLGGPAWSFPVGFSLGGRQRLQRSADHLQGEPGGSGAGTGRGWGRWSPLGPAGSSVWGAFKLAIVTQTRTNTRKKGFFFSPPSAAPFQPALCLR